MLNRSRRNALALPALSALLLAAACAQAPEKVETGVEDGISNKHNLTIAQVAKGQSQRRLAMPVAASAEESAALAAKNPGVQQFLSGEGKGWSVVFDRRSGAPMYFEGPGLAWTPGRGNALTASSVYGAGYSTLGAAQPKAVSARLQAMATGLLNRHQGLVGVGASGLSLDARWSGAQDETGELLLATFRHAPNGTEVSDARLTYVVNNGNLVQIHAEKLVPAPAQTASLTSDQAWEVLRKSARILQTPRMMTSELKVAPLAPASSSESSGVFTGTIGAGYETHLAYLFRFQLPGDTKTYAAWVDASSGETLDLWDDNRYQVSHVEGSIYPRTDTQAEVVVPFQYTAVTAGSAQRSDLGGNFTAAASASSALSGTFFSVNDDCGAPAGTASSGNLTFSASTASDCTFSTSGHSTRASRNAFYHLNIVRQMGAKWLGTGYNSTATSWFATNVGANVNIQDTCNAYWDGTSVNFFRSDSTCANTGEIADVMQHEYGHGLDSNTKSGSTGDTAKGEAVADTVALLLSRDNCVGPGFFKTTGNGETTACPSAVRDLKYSVTKATIATKCQKSSSCAGALGYECHCESHLLSGATWDLAQAYVTRYGAEEGWHQFERTYLRALPMITAYLANTAGNAYSAFLAADDDNGNTTDGTPNSDLISAAFNARGLANTTMPAAKTVACPTRPAAVALTAAAGAGKVDLSWSALSGATGYTVLRRLVGHTAAFLPVGAATAAAYSDTQVYGGVAYEYSVYGTAGACTSPLAAPQAATPTNGTTPPPANDFGLALSPASVTVSSGASGSVSVATTITSGSAQTVSLSIAGLPAGVTASFNPASVTAGGSSTLTLTAASSAAAATAAATITGTATSGSHTASLGVTVTSTPPPANDFTIAVSPGSLTVAAGASGVATVSTTVKSGSAQTITLSVSGLPAGVTGTFSPASVTAGGTSTLTLAAASSAVAATASVALTGAAASGSHTAALALTVTGTTPPPAPGALTNGDFENALTGWTVTNKVSLSTDVHGGKSAAQVGLSTPFNGHSTLTQAFVVPAAGVSTLSFYWKGFNPGADTTKYSQQIAELRSSTGATLLSFFNTLSNDSAYKLVSQDVSAYQGQTVTLYFESHDDGYSADPTWMLVDDVTLVNAQPDTQAPVASFSAPSASATLSGTVTVTASATDDVGVTKVELFADGVSLGAAAAASASAQWNTTTVADGAHSLSVKASDAAGNVGTATLAVTVKNTTTPPPSTGVVNGDFENKLTGWLTGGTQAPLASVALKHGGTYSGRMGWMTGTTVPASDSALGQNVAIPASATSAVLTFWVYRFSEDVSAYYDWQTAAIRKTDGTVLKTIFDDLYNDQVWVRYTVDLTSYKGTTVQLFWNAHNDGDGYRTTLWVDDVVLSVQ